ncbi:MAG TPA: GTPase [Polyangiaceae bacterium]
MEDPRAPIAETIRRLEQLLELMPSDSVKNLRHRIATLRATLLESRPPALLLVGRRGSGKSSLVNALFGKKLAEVGHVKAQTGRGKWYEYTSDRGALSILDSRGLQEGGDPAEADEAKTPIQSIGAEINRKPPDLLLFVVRAMDVDSAIARDLDLLEEVARLVERATRKAPSIVAVVTHCDVLEPKDASLDDVEKLGHVRLAERTLDEHIRARPKLAAMLAQTVAVSGYMSFAEDGALRADQRWHVDELIREIFNKLPDQGRSTFARVTGVVALQDQLAQDLTYVTAALCAGIGIVPIPVADMVPITSLQVVLVAGVAYIAGRPLDTKSAAEFLSAMGVNVGAAFALREAARALVKFVFPGAGSAISGAVAFTGTLAIGAAARAYFVHGEPIEVAKKVFKERRSRD